MEKLFQRALTTHEQLKKQFGHSIIQQHSVLISACTAVVEDFNHEQYFKNIKDIQTKARRFSELRQNSVAQAILSYYMQIKDINMNQIEKNRKILETNKMKSKLYTYLCAPSVISENHIKKAAELYREVKSNHDLYTGGETYIIPIMIAAKEGDRMNLEEVVSKMEYYYYELVDSTNIFGDYVRVASQILALNSNYTKDFFASYTIAIKNEIELSHYLEREMLPYISILALANTKGREIEKVLTVEKEVLQAFDGQITKTTALIIAIIFILHLSKHQNKDKLIKTCIDYLLCSHIPSEVLN